MERGVAVERIPEGVPNPPGRLEPAPRPLPLELLLVVAQVGNFGEAGEDLYEARRHYELAQHKLAQFARNASEAEAEELASWLANKLNDAIDTTPLSASDTVLCEQVPLMLKLLQTVRDMVDATLIGPFRAAAHQHFLGAGKPLHKALGFETFPPQVQQPLPDAVLATLEISEWPQDVAPGQTTRVATKLVKQGFVSVTFPNDTRRKKFQVQVDTKSAALWATRCRLVRDHAKEVHCALTGPCAHGFTGAGRCAACDLVDKNRKTADRVMVLGEQICEVEQRRTESEASSGGIRAIMREVKKHVTGRRQKELMVRRVPVCMLCKSAGF